jgi:ribosomal protein L32
MKKLAERAQLKKPINPHNLRHSAITRSAMLGMSDIDISMRYWGSAHSDMLNIYIHLSKQMNSDSYRRTMGMGGEESKIINPIASRCVECGHLIPSGKLCKQCEDNKNLTKKLQKMEQGKKDSDAKIEFLTNAVSKILAGNATIEIGKEILKDKK